MTQTIALLPHAVSLLEQRRNIPFLSYISSCKLGLSSVWRWSRESWFEERVLTTEREKAIVLSLSKEKHLNSISKRTTIWMKTAGKRKNVLFLFHWITSLGKMVQENVKRGFFSAKTSHRCWILQCKTLTEDLYCHCFLKESVILCCSQPTKLFFSL